ncbi:rhomboid family intramembrane serine protease [Emticicia agri]|uniref:Rhomboid family intramembrane serine protease n=1 Tax=Emticicia agri TaxID=2492393 RepID=A0A4Q5LXX9_9BACT|nr:rhomboid family intramembrane serine protease [Emticicia agri]RYU94701.1 rhomboid family intramembrane serine protease [Emticicia agri]
MSSIPFTFIIIGITVLVSLAAFSNKSLEYRYILNPYIVHRRKEWWRLLTSGFLHGDFAHLFFNMLSLFLFGLATEARFHEIFGEKAVFFYLLLYLSGIIIANLPDTFSKKNHSGYNALGASGGVSSIVFAFIMFEPTAKMGAYILPPFIPAWIFGLLYLWYSKYMAEKQYDNIGHTAHFWGALWGVIFMILTFPPIIRIFITKIAGSFQ